MKTQTTEAWPFPKIMPSPNALVNNHTDVEELGIDLNLDLLGFGKVYADEISASMKRYRAAKMEAAKEAGIGIVHIFNDGEKGGLTVAFRIASKYSSGRMVEVAVATCSIEDHFNKKIGAVVAIDRFFEGDTIELPLLQNFKEPDLSYAVKQAFTAFYSVI